MQVNVEDIRALGILYFDYFRDIKARSSVSYVELWRLLTLVLYLSAACKLVREKAAEEPDFLNYSVDKYVKVLDTWNKKFNFKNGNDETWFFCFQLLYVDFCKNSNHVKLESWKAIVPLYLAFIVKPGIPAQSQHSLITTINSLVKANVEAFQHLSSKIVEVALGKNIPDLSCSVRVLYPYQKYMVIYSLEVIVKWALNLNMHAIETLELIAIDSPDSLTPYVDNLITLLSGTTALLTSKIIRLIAANNASAFSSKLEAIKQAYYSYIGQNIDNFRSNIIAVFGLVGRTSAIRARECLSILAKIQLAHFDDAPTVLFEFQNIGGAFKSVLQEYRNDIQTASRSPFDNVRAQATFLLDYLNNDTAQSLSFKTQAITRSTMDMRRAHIEQLEEIEAARQHIDKRLAEMEFFISRIIPQVPIPKNFSVDSALLKTIQVDFECYQQDTQCFHDKKKPFEIISVEWQLWLRLAIIAIHLKHSKCNNEQLDDALQGPFELYKLLKNPDDPEFHEFCKEPFLQEEEQELMIHILQDENFFDTFKYQPSVNNWVCAKCAKSMVLQRQSVSVQNSPSDSGTPSELKHAFVRHHFHKFTWCVYCDKFIWGLGKQGYKCTKCKYRCHPECRSQVPDNCGKIDVSE